MSAPAKTQLSPAQGEDRLSLQFCMSEQQQQQQQKRNMLVLVAPQTPKATEFLSTGRTCLLAGWISTTKRRVFWWLNGPQPWLPNASTHLWAQLSCIRNSSFGGGHVFFSGVGYFKPLSDAVSHQPKRTAQTPGFALGVPRVTSQAVHSHIGVWLSPLHSPDVLE